METPILASDLSLNAVFFWGGEPLGPPCLEFPSCSVT